MIQSTHDSPLKGTCSQPSLFLLQTPATSHFVHLATLVCNTHVCMYACMYIFCHALSSGMAHFAWKCDKTKYACLPVCICTYVRTYICVHLLFRAHVCMHAFVYIRMLCVRFTCLAKLVYNIYTYMYTYMYMYMCAVCVHCLS